MTYEELSDFAVLYRDYLQTRKRKRSKKSTAPYEANALACTQKLSYQLKVKRYRPSDFHTFYVCDPKVRLVQAPAFVDKVVLHAVVDNVLYAAITQGFVRDNAASQINKGAHDAIYRLGDHMRDYYRKHGNADGWVVKCDVHHFFASIDHTVLKSKLRRLFAYKNLDMQLFDLLCVYIDASDGLPLGYQTSQLFALLFLDEYDHMIKEIYCCRYYGRYMDDFYIIVETKDAARRLLNVTRAWMAKNKLELNKKTAIFPLRNGLDFLGFHTYLTDSGKVIRKLGKKSLDRLKSDIRYWQKAYPQGEIEKSKIKEKWKAWDAHAAHGDTYALREKYAKIVGAIIGEHLQPCRKITSIRVARYRRRLRKIRIANKQAAANLGLPEITQGGVLSYGVYRSET